MDKELIYFFLKTKFDNEKDKIGDKEFFYLVNSDFSWKEYLYTLKKLDNKGCFEKGSHNTLSEYGKKYLKELEKEISEINQDEKISKKKLRNEYKLSELNIYNFWIVLFLGIVGFAYSTYDFFIKNPNSEEKLQQIEKDIQNNKDSIKVLNTLISNQRNKDSLNPPSY